MAPCDVHLPLQGVKLRLTWGVFEEFGATTESGFWNEDVNVTSLPIVRALELLGGEVLLPAEPGDADAIVVTDQMFAMNHVGTVNLPTGYNLVSPGHASSATFGRGYYSLSWVRWELQKMRLALSLRSNDE